MDELKVRSDFQPAGDQPSAIKKLSEEVNAGTKFQTLKGITGSGKTFTMAKVIENVQKPTLVLSHNKTLAAQLYREFKEFFPNNAVEYFVSYYDYYQPEAYVPGKDLFIDKDASINDEIDRLRLAATTSLYSRSDVIIIATVSCIYGLGNPQDYRNMAIIMEVGDELDIKKFRDGMIGLQYTRNDSVLERGRFRMQDEVIDVYPAYAEKVFRIVLDWDTVQHIYELDPITMEITKEQSKLWIFPAKHFVTQEEQIKYAVGKMREELAEQYQKFLDEGKLVEAERLKSRIEYDIEMLETLGYCTGIENYSMHLSGRNYGDRPAVLLDYFPKDFLLFIDESHVTIPQIGAMYEGDKARKTNLVDYGFRLPSAKDNRPLKFHEFEELINQCIFVSATPSKYELTHSKDVVEQIIRPTGLLDPLVTVLPTKGQIEDLVQRIRERIKNNERVLITTLTKNMSEHLSDYLSEMGFRIAYLHSDIDTIERVEILTKLRQGKLDGIVGINLLREGIDLPEVSLVAILDADKVGFLRSATSLIQTIGRSARNVNSHAVMYADKYTDAMKAAIEETHRRRKLQEEYNKKHGITPQTIKKAVKDILVRTIQLKEDITKEDIKMLKKSHNLLVEKDRKKLIKELTKRMEACAENLEFEEAAIIRDEIAQIRG